MRKYEFEHDGVSYVRVSKQKALKAYMAGNSVIISPCNLRPFSPWVFGCKLSRKRAAEFAIDEIGVANYFSDTVASFEYYNCVNDETGRYVAFYIARS